MQLEMQLRLRRKLVRVRCGLKRSCSIWLWARRHRKDPTVEHSGEGWFLKTFLKALGWTAMHLRF